MILDSIKNKNAYNFPKEFDDTFEFLATAEDKAEGRYDLNDGIFALVQHYNTYAASEGKLENHKKYIDLQYVIDGNEQMGIAFEGEVLVDYDAKKDIAFFADGKEFFVNMTNGDFVFLLPQDLHKPKTGDGSFVKKVVVKIPVELYVK